MNFVLGVDILTNVYYLTISILFLSFYYGPRKNMFCEFVTPDSFVTPVRLFSVTITGVIQKVLDLSMKKKI